MKAKRKMKARCRHSRRVTVEEVHEWCADCGALRRRRFYWGGPWESWALPRDSAMVREGNR